MPISGYDHVALPAGDPEALIAFYKKLGCGTIHEAEWRAGERIEGYSLRWDAVVRMGGVNNEAYFSELLEDEIDTLHREPQAIFAASQRFWRWYEGGQLIERRRPDGTLTAPIGASQLRDLWRSRGLNTGGQER